MTRLRQWARHARKEDTCCEVNRQRRPLAQLGDGASSSLRFEDAWHSCPNRPSPREVSHRLDFLLRAIFASLLAIRFLLLLLAALLLAALLLAVLLLAANLWLRGDSGITDEQHAELIRQLYQPVVLDVVRRLEEVFRLTEHRCGSAAVPGLLGGSRHRKQDAERSEQNGESSHPADVMQPVG